MIGFTVVGVESNLVELAMEDLSMGESPYTGKKRVEMEALARARRNKRCTWEEQYDMALQGIESLFPAEQVDLIDLHDTSYDERAIWTRWDRDTRSLIEEPISNTRLKGRPEYDYECDDTDSAEEGLELYEKFIRQKRLATFP